MQDSCRKEVYWGTMNDWISVFRKSVSLADENVTQIEGAQVLSSTAQTCILGVEHLRVTFKIHERTEPKRERTRNKVVVLRARVQWAREYSRAEEKKSYRFYESGTMPRRHARKGGGVALIPTSVDGTDIPSSVYLAIGTNLQQTKRTRGNAPHRSTTTLEPEVHVFTAPGIGKHTPSLSCGVFPFWTPQVLEVRFDTSSETQGTVQSLYRSPPKNV